MSSSSAGKFQDHYFVLGIDPIADTDIVQKAFQDLKARYDPKNKETADPEKYEAVHIAYEVLSDTSLRRAFDKMKGVNQNESEPQFSPEFFEAFGRMTVLRSALLCILYDRRRCRPYTPTLSMRALENMIDASSEELIVALWYLKQRHLVINDDKSSLQITVDGVDFLENHKPSPETVLAVIKATSIEGAAVPEPVSVEPIRVEPIHTEPVHVEPPPPPPPPAPMPLQFKSHESVLKVLNRALSRV